MENYKLYDYRNVEIVQSLDLYEHGIIEHDTIKELNNTYKFSKEHDLSKGKDDYDLEI